MPTDFITYDEASKRLTLTEKIGQSFMPAAYINDTEEEIIRLEQTISKYGIGGICFFHSRASAATNFEGPKEVIYNEKSLEVLKNLIKRYQKASKYPLLISIDAEWGLAMRIENTPQYPYALSLGAMQNQEELVYELGQRIGVDCRVAGIHWNFAPVVDVNNDPKNPVIGYRSFGEDPVRVSAYGMAFCRGMQSAGILTSAKHFPGHGDTATDSHLGLPMIDKSLKELLNNELKPFIELIEQGVDSVMIGHLAVPVLSNGRKEPASVSESIINGFLRKELGFQGVVVSDALNMYAVAKNFQHKGELEATAYNAGTDVLCYTQHIAEGIAAIEEKSTKETIERHFKRVWELKKRAFDAKGLSDKVEVPIVGNIMIRLAEESLTTVFGDDSIQDAFRTSGFFGISVGADENKVFLQLIQSIFPFEGNSFNALSEDELNLFLQKHPRILLALYPPSAKPAHNFGLSQADLEFIAKLCSTKEVLLYLFGNPYVLTLLKPDEFKGVCVAYQDFKEFEENAARHFLGEVKASGVLPVTLKSH